MDELIAGGRTTPPAHLSLPANISLMLQSCLVLIGMRGHALLPAFLPSAITSQFLNWLSRAVVFVHTNGHFAVVRRVAGRPGGWEGRGRDNGCRLMHNECLHYANELQQLLSYVPRNKLRLALMAKFCIR